MEPWHLFLTILLGFAFLAGWSFNTAWRDLTPYIIFWYNTTIGKPSYGEPSKPVAVKSMKDYDTLTLRKRFVMERDKRLN